MTVAPNASAAWDTVQLGDHKLHNVGIATQLRHGRGDPRPFEEAWHTSQRWRPCHGLLASPWIFPRQCLSLFQQVAEMKRQLVEHLDQQRPQRGRTPLRVSNLGSDDEHPSMPQMPHRTAQCQRLHQPQHVHVQNLHSRQLGHQTNRQTNHHRWPHIQKRRHTQNTPLRQAHRARQEARHHPRQRRHHDEKVGRSPLVDGGRERQQTCGPVPKSGTGIPVPSTSPTLVPE